MDLGSGPEKIIFAYKIDGGSEQIKFDNKKNGSERIIFISLITHVVQYDAVLNSPPFVHTTSF